METTPRNGAVTCLARAIDGVRDDPVGILLPAGGALLAQAWVGVAARAAWDRGWDVWVGVWVSCAVAAVVVSAPLRSRWIAVAARNAGLRAAPWGRPLSLLSVQLVVWALAASAAAAPAIPAVAIGGWLATRGWFATGAGVVACGVGLGAAFAVAVRSVFALAAPEVVVGRSSPWRALSRAGARGVRELGPLVLLVVSGDLLTGVGALLCGAAALPGYPITDLAVLHRWRAAEEVR